MRQNLRRQEQDLWNSTGGELALVEDARVENAMEDLGELVENGRFGEPMQNLSLALAHACGDSLAEFWRVKD